MKLARAAAAVAVSIAALSAVSFTSSTAFAQRGGAAKGDATTEELTLAIGQTKTLSAKDVKNFSEGSPGIIDVRLTTDGSQFIIAGKKQGQTTLLLIKNDGSQVTWTISVFTRDPAQVEKEVNQLIEGLSNVRLKRVGARFVLEGSVSNEADMRKINQIVSLYQGQVESLVTQGPGAGGSDRKLLVRLDFFFVQYEKTSSYAVGLGWPSQIGGNVNNAQVIQSQFSYDFIQGTTTTAQASIVNQPLPELDIAMRHGWAKVLKQSTVISSNGSEATFNSGGEQNFISSTGLQATLVKIQFGTNVTVLPRYDSQSREVEIKLDADVSDLTPPAVSGTTLPGRNTTKLNTFVNLKLGQALILSGIRTRNQRHDVTGLPGLSQIPVLGLLFGSHSDQADDVEGAVFIIPSIIETVPKSSIEVIKNALAAYDDYAGDIDHVDSFNKTPPSATK